VPMNFSYADVMLTAIFAVLLYAAFKGWGTL
jgi:hypothetical protein